jgi:hypothetical protein
VSILRVSNPWKAMADIKTYAIALNINHEIERRQQLKYRGKINDRVV